MKYAPVNRLSVSGNVYLTRGFSQTRSVMFFADIVLLDSWRSPESFCVDFLIWEVPVTKMR